jgi:hypothetical protein
MTPIAETMHKPETGRQPNGSGSCCADASRNGMGPSAVRSTY